MSARASNELNNIGEDETDPGIDEPIDPAYHNTQEIQLKINRLPHQS